eukprot:3036258-Rhodomonas_salina.2
MTSGLKPRLSSLKSRAWGLGSRHGLALSRARGAGLPFSQTHSRCSLSPGINQRKYGPKSNTKRGRESEIKHETWQRTRNQPRNVAENPKSTTKRGREREINHETWQRKRLFRALGATEHIVSVHTPQLLHFTSHQHQDNHPTLRLLIRLGSTTPAQSVQLYRNSLATGRHMCMVYGLRNPSLGTRRGILARYPLSLARHPQYPTPGGYLVFFELQHLPSGYLAGYLATYSRRWQALTIFPTDCPLKNTPFRSTAGTSVRLFSTAWEQHTLSQYRTLHSKRRARGAGGFKGIGPARQYSLYRTAGEKPLIAARENSTWSSEGSRMRARA